MTNTLDFALDLMRRESVTPKDAGCQDLIAEKLKAAGFTVERLDYGEVRNLWARHGSAQPLLCFAGHTDVVPPGSGEEWDTDPFDPLIRDGRLYGRGAADMKTSLAAMVDAAIDFANAHPKHRGSLAFLITSDEEGRARDGTRKVIETLTERGEKIDWCVVGEPSSSKTIGDTIKVGRRGSLSGQLQINGQQGHVAYPELARNPIRDFAPVLAELTGQQLDDGNSHFPPSGLQFVRIYSDAGAVNVTPGALTTRFNIRYSTVWTHEKLKAHVEGILSKYDIDYELEWFLSGEPFFTPDGPLIDATCDAVKKVTGLSPDQSTAGGTSDGRFIAPSGADVVEFGTVNATIHKVNENIAVADIDAMRRVYFEIMINLLA